MKEITLISFPQTNGLSNLKVPGIKAVRCFSGLGLKEAKDIIERVQDGNPTKVALRRGENEADDALKEFQRLGGVVSLDDRLAQLLDEALKIAVDRKQYDVVTNIATALDIIL